MLSSDNTLNMEQAGAEGSVAPFDFDVDLEEFIAMYLGPSTSNSHDDLEMVTSSSEPESDICGIIDALISGQSEDPTPSGYSIDPVATYPLVSGQQQSELVKPKINVRSGSRKGSKTELYQCTECEYNTYFKKAIREHKWKSHPPVNQQKSILPPTGSISTSTSVSCDSPSNLEPTGADNSVASFDIDQFLNNYIDSLVPSTTNSNPDDFGTTKSIEPESGILKSLTSGQSKDAKPTGYSIDPVVKHPQPRVQQKRLLEELEPFLVFSDTKKAKTGIKKAGIEKQPHKKYSVMSLDNIGTRNNGKNSTKSRISERKKENQIKYVHFPGTKRLGYKETTYLKTVRKFRDLPTGDGAEEVTEVVKIHRLTPIGFKSKTHLQSKPKEVSNSSL